MSTTDGEREELRSLREHLDTSVKRRLVELELVAECARNYLNCFADGSSRREMQDALTLLIAALGRAGYVET